MLIDMTKTDASQSYALLTQCIIPRPVVLVTSLAEDGTLNGAPFSFISVVVADPPLVCLSVFRKNGRQKDTARNILRNGEFVIHTVGLDCLEQVNATAATLPPDVSEPETVGMRCVDSFSVSVPSVKDGPVRLECVLESAQTIRADDGRETCDFIIGRVHCIYIDDEITENGRVSPEKLKPVSRLSGSDYAQLREVFSIARPE